MEKKGVLTSVCLCGSVWKDIRKMKKLRQHDRESVREDLKDETVALEVECGGGQMRE